MAESGVFIRKASGLVRDISPTHLIFFNYLTAPVWLSSWFSFTQNPNIFPGNNFLLSILCAVIIATPMFLAYAIIYSAFPKTGTDYVFQSRVLHPAIAFASTFAAWVIYQFWYVAWNGISLVEYFIQPYLTVLSYHTGSEYYATLATTLMDPVWLTTISLVLVILPGLVLMGGLRLYLKIQAILFVMSIVAVVAMFTMLAGTSHEAFVTNFNTYMSPYLGTADSYNAVMNTAREAQFDLAPPFSWWATIGAIVVPWTLNLEWMIFGNLGLGGEMKLSNTVKAHLTSILGAFYLLCVVMAALWALYIGMVGEQFWNAVSYLAWNGHEIFSKVPSMMYYPFVVAIGTNNVSLLTVFTVAACLQIMCTQFTIYVLVARMLFAQTFDRFFPSGLAYVAPRTHTPVYIMVVMMILSVIWTLAVLFYGSVIYSYLSSTQFQICLTMILTMIGGLVFPARLRSLYEKSPVSRYKALLVVCAIAGIVWNLVLVYYLLVVPGLYATIPESEALTIGVFVGGIIYYYIVKVIRRSQGINIELAFHEIPPD